MPLRYLLSASAAYGVFFLLVRLWIAYALRAVDTSSEPGVGSPPPPPVRHTPTTQRTGTGRRELPWPVRILGQFVGEAVGELLGYLLLFLLIVGSLLIVAAYLVWQGPVILLQAALVVWVAATVLLRIPRFAPPG